jgi:hypothetical protein
MIQLASDPTASRVNWRPAMAEGKEIQEMSSQARRGRSGHAWPFISRYAEKPGSQQQAKKPSSDHGS